jgi:DNA-binding NtrC family response regulator
VVPIEIPPLRDRRVDIEPLASFLLARVGARQGRALRFSPDVLRLLLEHPWPGNVRELENSLEYAVAVCKGQTILPEDLPGEVGAGPGPAVAAVSAPLAPGRPAPSRRAEADAIDSARIRGALEASHWRRHEAAQILGVSRTTLWRRMRELGL